MAKAHREWNFLAIKKQVATEEEISKFMLPEPQDYNAEILKLEPVGSSHSLNLFTNEVYELRKELVKANENHKSLEEKVEAGFVKMRKFVIDSHTKLLEDMKLLFAKANGNESQKSANRSMKPKNPQHREKVVLVQ